MVVEASPASAQNGFTICAEIIGRPESWVVKRSSCWESTQRNGAVFGVPFESAERRRSCAGCTTAGIIGGRVEDGVAEVFAVNPRRKMGKTHAYIERQPSCNLPRILEEELNRFVVDIIYPVEVRFGVIAQVAGQQVGILIAIAETIARGDLQKSGGFVVCGLSVANPLIEETSLQSVILDHLGERIAHTGHVLVGVKTLGRSAGFESAGIE